MHAVPQAKDAEEVASADTLLRRIVALVRALPGEADLVIDATGVGRPVLDMLRAAGLEPVAVTITGGRSASFDGGTWRVPKRMLVGALATAFEAGRLKVARSLPSAGALLAELQAFRRQISRRGHDSYAGAGVHDDLVIATALACWWPETERRGESRFRQSGPNPTQKQADENSPNAPDLRPRT